MIHYKRDIVDFFPDKDILHKYCDRINQSDADVYIIMAHKAVQLFRVLVDQDYIHISLNDKVIISSQALDFDCSYLKNKKIIIIDDIIISGTSIASAMHKLINLGIDADNIEIIALARDTDYQTMVFENNSGDNILGCNTLLEDTECIELSYLISKAFCYYGTPYNVDFPTYDFIIGQNKEQAFFREFLWDTFSTTNDDQQVGVVSSFSIFPKSDLLNCLWKKIGVNLSKCSHLKLRTYIRRYNSGYSDCTIVPMCLFDEISENDVNKLYTQLAPDGGVYHLSFVAKMRYLEFWISCQLYQAFAEFADFDDKALPNLSEVNLLFGHQYGACAFSFLEERKGSKKVFSMESSLEYIDSEMLDEFYKHEIGREVKTTITEARNLPVDDQIRVGNQIIMAPFLWWYDTKEMPVRKKLMEPIRNAIHDYAYIEKNLTRLNYGFSRNTLHYLLSSDCTNKEVETLVSVFLDRAIDQGVIVPTISHNTNKHFLCRAFRHGEDLPFGIEDECRLALFLKEISQKIKDIDYKPTTEPKDGGISEIAFEKIIVLFYQMGLRQGGIFNHFLGFNNIKILKPFLSLHGAIEAYIDPEELAQMGIEQTHFYSEKDSSGNKYITWLTSWAKNQGFAWNSLDQNGNKTSEVFLNKDKLESYLSTNERNCINSTINKRITTIADIVATWYNNCITRGKRADFKDDATALTSCANAYTFLSAIATELHYFSKFWNNQVKKALQKASDYSEIDWELHADKADKQNKLNIVQGLNSGRNKVGWYHSNAAKAVVEKVSNILQGSDITYWNDTWSTVKTTPESVEELIAKYIDQAVALLYFFSACLDCLTSEYFWENGETPTNYDEYKQQFHHRIGAFRNWEAEKSFRIIEELAHESDFCRKRDSFLSKIQIILDESNDLVNNIEYEIERKDPNFSVEYVSSLFFEVNAIDPQTADSKIMEVWRKQEDLSTKTQLNIIRFASTPEEPSVSRYGFFYGISEKYSGSTYSQENDYTEHSNVLLSLYNDACNQFNCRCSRIRAILIPQLPAGRRFRHNAQKNIDRYSRRFQEQVIQDLERLYIEEANSQLVLAITLSVNRDVVSKVKDMNWPFSQEVTKLKFVHGFSEIYVYHNIPTPCTAGNEISNIFYSSVVIHCGTNSGMGLLVRTNNRVICVTCNHIVVQYSESIPIIAYCNPETSFILNPVKPIRGQRKHGELVPARDELTLLEPMWSIYSPLNVSKIISIENMCENLDEHINSSIKCCGQFNTFGRAWKEPVKLVGSTTEEYYQMTDTGNVLNCGCSGGVMVLTNDERTIIGIYKGKFFNHATKKEECVHLIPSSIIIEEIFKLEENN